MAKSGTPIYELYHVNQVNHFYTSNPGEIARAIQDNGFRFHGIAFFEPADASKKVYRLQRNVQLGEKHYSDYFYTANLEEALEITRHGWVYEGVAFRTKCVGACENDDPNNLINIYKFYQPNYINHYYKRK